MHAPPGASGGFPPLSGSNSRSPSPPSSLAAPKPAAGGGGGLLSPVVLQLSSQSSFGTRRDSLPLAAAASPSVHNRVFPLNAFPGGEEDPCHYDQEGQDERPAVPPFGSPFDGRGRRGPKPSAWRRLLPRRFGAPRTERAFLAKWSHERLPRARTAVGLALVALAAAAALTIAALARGSLRLAGSIPGASFSDSLPPVVPQVAAAFGVALLAIGLLAISLVGPEGGFMRRHWPHAACAATLGLHCSSFLVAEALLAPSCHLVSVAVGSLLSCTLLGLRCVQVIAVNGGGLALAVGLAASFGDLPEAWETAMSLPGCAAAVVSAIVLASKEETAARDAFAEDCQSMEEVQDFRREYTPLLAELSSFRSTADDLGYNSSLTSAVSLLGDLFDRLLFDARMDQAHAVASAIRHLLSESHARSNKTVAAAMEEMAASPEDDGLLRDFQEWMRRQAGEVDAKLHSVSFRRPKSSRSLSIAPPPAAAERVPPSLSEALSGDVAEAAAAADSARWDDFDAIQLEAVSGGRPLEILARELARRSSIRDSLEIDAGRFRAFVAAIEQGYNRVPYHTSTHAADVVQAMHYLVYHGGLRQYLRPIDLLAALVAAIVHDVCHSGRNNGFEIATSSELSLLYNDQSVLENHSLTRTFELLRDPQTNFIGHLPKEKRVEFRRAIIGAVLATDMARHFEKLSEFKARVLAANVEAAGARVGSPSGTGRGLDTPGGRPAASEAAAPAALSDPDRALFLSMCLKVADISNAARPRYQHVEWTNRVNEEFHQQGDEERRLGLPISPYCDRETAIVSQTTAGFISFLALPLFQAWASRFPASRLLVEHAEKNLAHWKGAYPGAGKAAGGGGTGPATSLPPAPAPAPGPRSSQVIAFGSPRLRADAAPAQRAAQDSPRRLSPMPARRASQASVEAGGRRESAAAVPRPGDRRTSPVPLQAPGGPTSDGDGRAGVRRRSSLAVAAQEALQAALGGRFWRKSGARDGELEGATPDELVLLSARNSVDLGGPAPRSGRRAPSPPSTPPLSALRERGGSSLPHSTPPPSALRAQD